MKLNCARWIKALLGVLAWLSAGIFIGATERAEAADTGCYSLVEERYDDGSLIEPAPVCVALTRNLNLYCESAPHVCEVPIGANCGELSAPKWEALDPEKSYSLLERLVKGTWEPNRAASPENFQRPIDESLLQYRGALSAGRLKIDQSRFDIANGFGPESVYRVDTGKCEADLSEWKRNPHLRSFKEVTGFARTPEQENYRGTYLAQSDPVFYTQSAAEVADGKRPVMQLAGGGATFRGRTFSGLTGTIFFYAQKTYRTVWQVGRDSLVVLQPKPTEPAGFFETLCEIQYQFHQSTPLR